jgi:hypothetical protein
VKRKGRKKNEKEAENKTGKKTQNGGKQRQNWRVSGLSQREKYHF